MSFGMQELQIVLEYSRWENFKKVIDRAIVSLETEGIKRNDWLLHLEKPIITGKGKEESYFISTVSDHLEKNIQKIRKKSSSIFNC